MRGLHERKPNSEYMEFVATYYGRLTKERVRKVKKNSFLAGKS